MSHRLQLLQAPQTIIRSAQPDIFKAVFSYPMPIRRQTAEPEYLMMDPRLSRPRGLYQDSLALSTSLP